MDSRNQQPAAVVFQTKSATTQGRSLQSLLASLSIAAAVFLVEASVFLILRVRFPGIYRHQSYQHATCDKTIRFKSSDAEIITRCGLDAYLFLRYLRLLLTLFVPLALVILPVLIPVNLISGDDRNGVTGLDRLSWINVASGYTTRYWVHTLMALLVVLWVGYTFAKEMEFYSKLRQHNLKISRRSEALGSTVLITDIPLHLRDVAKLRVLYGIYPGGVSSVTINRNYDLLLDDIDKRNRLSSELEDAETTLICKANLRWKRSKLRDSDQGKVSSSFAGLQEKIAFERTPVNARSKESLESPGKPTRTPYSMPSDRKTLRVSDSSWVPSALLFTKPEDSIEYCRRELHILNLRIVEARERPETSNVIGSAFVRFNEPRGAHMASQCITHPRPRTMIACPVQNVAGQVVWKHIALSWWERYVRSLVTKSLISLFTVGCILPVAFTGLLSQLMYLSSFFPWLHWVVHLPHWLVALVQGVLPPSLLAVVMILAPLILRCLVEEQGKLTRVAEELSMQRHYFIFLFVQLFMVVSISSSTAAFLSGLTQDVKSIAALIASNLPKASNYFFSYMLLQGLSVSAATLLQLNRILARLMANLHDNTARQKWMRNVEAEISWGSFFPVYTNLAVIGIIYSVVSPLILAFDIFTFALFYAVQRYNILHVSKSNLDTGGLIYPEALNQLFLGLYVMEIYLIGLFCLVRDDHNQFACLGQIVVITLIAIFTLLYQRIVNQSYQSHFEHLSVCDEKEVDDKNAIKALKLQKRLFNMIDACCKVALLRFFDVDRNLGMVESGDEMEATAESEAESRSGNSLELLPTAIQTLAPTVWLPKDDLGISAYEIDETRRVSTSIPISDENASLDSKARIVYVDGPPSAKLLDVSV